MRFLYNTHHPYTRAYFTHFRINWNLGWGGFCSYLCVWTLWPKIPEQHFSPSTLLNIFLYLLDVSVHRKRMTIQDSLQHPWIKVGFYFLFFKCFSFGFFCGRCWYFETAWIFGANFVPNVSCPLCVCAISQKTLSKRWAGRSLPSTWKSSKSLQLGESGK